MKERLAKSWLEALAYTAGFVRGWMGVLAARSSTSSKKLLMLPGSGALARRAGGLSSLRRALFGYNKREVARTLGPPRAAAVSAATSPLEDPQFWNADIWYYPFDPARRSAVAVQFRRGRVNAVDFIRQLA